MPEGWNLKPFRHFLCLCSSFQHDHVFHVLRMREHVHGAYSHDFVLRIQQSQVTCLCGRIATDVTIRCGAANKIVSMTSLCMPALGGSVMITSGWPCVAMNSLFRMSFMSPAKNRVLPIPLICELILASSMASGHILYSDDLPGFPGHEIGNGSGSGIQVVNQFRTGEACKVPRYLI